MSLIDDYFASIDDVQRNELEHVRRVVRGMVPDAKEAITYGIPSFKYQGQPLIGFNAYQDHLSIYPFSPKVIEQVGMKLIGYQLSKGTIRFTIDHPVPDELLQEIIMFRLQEIIGVEHA